MTRAQGQAHWASDPSLCDHWIASMLRTLAMLVSNLARLFPSKHQTQTAECDGGEVHAREASAPRPNMNRNSSNNNTTPTAVATRDASIEGLMVRTIAQSAIVDSNHETGLTGEHEQPQQQQQRNNTATLQSPNKVRAPYSLNASFSGLSRESRFERRWNSQDSRRPTNRDSRDKPENDALRRLRLTPRT